MAATFSALKVNGQDTLVLKVLEENAPKYFNAPGMPRFSVIGNERAFYLGIGGYIRGTASYDFGNPIQSPLYFIPSAIPMDGEGGNSSLLQFSAASSNLFFNFVALPHTENKVGAYIDFGFAQGMGNYGFSLKAAYLTYRNLTVGYTTSLFTDGAAAAQTIDQQGPNAMTFLFNTVIDYQWPINRHWKVGVGLEMPKVDASYLNSTRAVNQRVPDIPVYVQYSWKEGKGWLRLSGIMRNMYYRDQVAMKTDDVMGLGIKLSGVSPLTRSLNLYSQSVFGKGISSYVQDLQGLGMDLVPVTGNGGQMEAVEVVASYLGLQYMISQKLSISSTFSEVKAFLPKNHEYMDDSTYKQGMYWVNTIIYRVSPVLTTGVEYLWGSRTNRDDTVHHNSRFQLSMRVNF